LKELISVKSKLKAGKLSQREADKARKDAFELIDVLVEYAQRQDLACKERGTMQILYEDGKKKAELVLMGKGNEFFIEGESIRKITGRGLVKSSREEFEKAFMEHKGRLTTKVPVNVFVVLKKELGEFEIVF
jgi:hypothetical protein